MMVRCELFPHELDTLFLMGLYSASNMRIDVDKVMMIFLANVYDNFSGIWQQRVVSVIHRYSSGEACNVARVGTERRTFIINAHRLELNSCDFLTLVVLLLHLLLGEAKVNNAHQRKCVQGWFYLPEHCLACF